MKSNQNMNTASNAEIVRLTVAAFEAQFQPGDRADINWVTKCCYEYQELPVQRCPVAELEQDIVWEALRINPDTTTWSISSEDYEAAMLVINPRRAQFRALAKNKIDM